MMRLQFRFSIVGFLIASASTAVARGDILVSSRLSNQVLRYTDGGSFIDVFADGSSGLFTPNGVVQGPDGWVYVSSRDGGQILRYDATSSELAGVFAQGPEMRGPSGLTFGPDGDLYVANSLADNISRYDHNTGSLLVTFGTGGELSAPIGVCFGPDHRLYVTSALNSQLVRYTLSDLNSPEILFQGAPLANPVGSTFGPDGIFYNGNSVNNRITRYDPGLNQLTSLAFNTNFRSPVAVINSLDNQLLVASFNGDSILRVNRTSGTILGTLITAQAGGLDGPQFLTYVPEPSTAGVIICLICATALNGRFIRNSTITATAAR